MGSVNKMLQNIASISKVLQECTGESVLCRQTPGMNSNKKKILFNFSAGTLCVGRAESILQSKCLTLQPRRNEFRQDAAVLLQAGQASWILHWQVKSIRSPEHKELLGPQQKEGQRAKHIISDFCFWQPEEILHLLMAEISVGMGSSQRNPSEAVVTFQGAVGMGTT